MDSMTTVGNTAYMTPELYSPELLPALAARAQAPARATGKIGLGEMTKNLLMKAVDGRGLPYATILSMIQDEHPGRSSIHCVRWYASKLNKAGAAMPLR